MYCSHEHLKFILLLRYTPLVFVQLSNFSQVVPGFVNAFTLFANFNISQFAAQMGLGSPIAGNYFLTGPDIV